MIQKRSPCAQPEIFDFGLRSAALRPQVTSRGLKLRYGQGKTILSKARVIKSGGSRQSKSNSIHSYSKEKLSCRFLCAATPCHSTEVDVAKDSEILRSPSPCVIAVCCLAAFTVNFLSTPEALASTRRHNRQRDERLKKEEQNDAAEDDAWTITLPSAKQVQRTVTRSFDDVKQKVADVSGQAKDEGAISLLKGGSGMRTPSFRASQDAVITLTTGGSHVGVCYALLPRRLL
ncbi:hypothetical protein CYMTET_44788 [Cymbomonas tetramitiformis]|uniref:Uncharacterized protein n=1 Tax=Cymbomonas tetramitiformis TaxID=36881 RepID=A0AAE0C0Q0_9CHLO|nr:hypothetical protein CYMTET_44788 [Cymbomonas tetramitiformis]